MFSAFRHYGHLLFYSLSIALPTGTARRTCFYAAPSMTYRYLLPRYMIYRSSIATPIHQPQKSAPLLAPSRSYQLRCTAALLSAEVSKASWSRA